MTKVLEIGGYAAGYAGRLFVRAGYDVVRAELNSKPAWASQEAMNAYLHAGKRRVNLDEQLSELAAAADIVVCEVDRADEFETLGFDEWAAPIKVALTPFGRTGPKANWAASPNTILAMGGYTNLMGDAGRTPLTLPGHYLEFQTGAVGYSAAMAAGYAKRSAVVDIGMLETLMSLSQFTTVMWHCAGEIRSRHGSDFWSVSPSDLFRCADGWVYINIVPTFWDPFLALLGLPDLVLDSRFETNDSRIEHRDDLREIIASAFLPMTRAGIDEGAAAFRVPLGVVRTMDRVLEEAHLQERAFWEEVETESGKAVKSPGLPYNISDRERQAWRTKPVQATE
jgi:crotonobetainyl-CoA:carnitine CoA-transferase CaiB-like acyl-CoA transferase